MGASAVFPARADTRHAPLEREYFAACCQRVVHEQEGDAAHVCAPSSDRHACEDGTFAYRLPDGALLRLDPYEPFRYAGPALAPAPAKSPVALDHTRALVAGGAFTLAAIVLLVLLLRR